MPSNPRPIELTIHSPQNVNPPVGILVFHHFPIPIKLGTVRATTRTRSSRTKPPPRLPSSSSEIDRSGSAVTTRSMVPLSRPVRIAVVAVGRPRRRRRSRVPPSRCSKLQRSENRISSRSSPLPQRDFANLCRSSPGKEHGSQESYTTERDDNSNDDVG